MNKDSLIQNNSLVSIIIPALNEESYIQQCLLSIFNLNVPKNSFEIIVVDNGSIDKTRDIAKRNKAITLLLPEVNIAALRNFGAKVANGDILAFLDADCVVEGNWFTSAINTIKCQNVAAVGFPHKVPPGSSWVARSWNAHKLKREKIYFTNYIPSGNFFIRKDCFMEVGGFNEKLSVSEDTDLCYRLRQNNYKILANSEIAAIHLKEPQDLSHFFKKELWHGKDVFSLFLASKLRMHNIKVIMYSLFYVFIILGIILSAIFVKFQWTLFLIFLSFFVGFILALKTSVQNNILKYFFGLCVLYQIYGIARALCILDYRNWIHKSL